jgi:glutathione synthase/RimK-type ligase-like ATP-grasp enzyme
MGHRIAVAACEEVPDLDDDWPLLRAALTARGVVATSQIWTDPSVDWASYELVVVRGTWDYYYSAGRLQRFREWVRRVESGTRLVNPASVIEWNTDKRYLVDLEAAGVAVVATSWVPPGQPWQVPADEFVVKPAVSAGGYETARYGPSEGEAAERHVRRLHEAGSVVMVQPYVSSVDDEGETALIYLGGRFSHAINKASLLRAGAGVDDRLWARERITATQPSDAQLRVAEAALAASEARTDATSYARVDLLSMPGAGPAVSEIELVEPGLFLRFCPDTAPDRFAEVLAELL